MRRKTWNRAVRESCSNFVSKTHRAVCELKVLRKVLIFCLFYFYRSLLPPVWQRDILQLLVLCRAFHVNLSDAQWLEILFSNFSLHGPRRVFPHTLGKTPVCLSLLLENVFVVNQNSFHLVNSFPLSSSTPSVCAKSLHHSSTLFLSLQFHDYDISRRNHLIWRITHVYARLRKNILGHRKNTINDCQSDDRSINKKRELDSKTINSRLAV